MPSKFKVIAIDPGGTTGITIARRTGGVIDIVTFQEAMRPKRFNDFLWTHANSATTIICEDFEFRKAARAGLDLTPAHLIGVVLMNFEGDERLVMQKASYGIGGHFAQDAKIKDMKLWVPGKPHAMDSLRHFLQWYFFGPGYKYHDDSTMLRLAEEAGVL